ncbi:uncharacterized protein GGS25DRAFT_502741 [Hypoxylon fragiforme]|uniref:uncharacterized protein n=1 Tax=Hypoxylon fragiforme TaxID=63214 RepID=UPI0020C67D53|nr:uncharacterized protein GGS25DRAFT_502741 [Hypoxylon fragiforme]KAI2604954.1 hypothetical protein GGS25DRAFT_502741 [Hypoxylon fragiforme]
MNGLRNPLCFSPFLPFFLSFFLSSSLQFSFLFALTSIPFPSIFTYQLLFFFFL